MGRSFHSPKTRSKKAKALAATLCVASTTSRSAAPDADKLRSARGSSAVSRTLNWTRARTMIARTALRRASLLGKSRAFASIGDKAPDVGLDVSFPGPKEVNFAQRCKGRRVILLGLPGAFTPT